MGDWGLQVEGYTPPPNQGTPGDWQVVTPGYFEAMGLKLREGRFFDARDGMDAPLAMIVNRTFVEQYFAGRERARRPRAHRRQRQRAAVHDRRRGGRRAPQLRSRAR